MKHLIYISVLLLSFINIQAQDFTFSQFYEMPLMRNPALAGIFEGGIRVESAYRSQWSSVTVPYDTKALSTEVKFKIGRFDDYISVGLQLNNDQAGDSKLGRTQILPVINFHKSINDYYSYLSFALMGGLVQSQFDPTKLTFDDQYQNGQYNPYNSTQDVFSKTSISHKEIGAGLAYSSSIDGEINYYFGLSGYHLLKSNVSFFDAQSVYLKPRFVVNGGLNLPTGDLDNAYFYGDYILQGGNRQFLMGMIFSHILAQNDPDDATDKVAINVGGSYRWADAFIPTLKLEMRKFAIGASYDVNVSKLKTFSQLRGGFEITASFRSFLNAQNARALGVKCPGGF